MQNLMLACLVVVAAHSALMLTDSVFRVIPERSMPAQKTTPHARMCADLYMTLLWCKRQDPSSVPASVYLRQFFETEECDDVYHFSADRDFYALRIGAERLQRVLDFDSDSRDELVVAQAVLHVHRVQEARLFAALDPTTRVAFQIFMFVERVFGLGMGVILS